jgi:chromosome segregation ATPase
MTSSSSSSSSSPLSTPVPESAPLTQTGIHDRIEEIAERFKDTKEPLATLILEESKHIPVEDRAQINRILGYYRASKQALTRLNNVEGQLLAEQQRLGELRRDLVCARKRKQQHADLVNLSRSELERYSDPAVNLPDRDLLVWQTETQIETYTEQWRKTEATIDNLNDKIDDMRNTMDALMARIQSAQEERTTMTSRWEHGVLGVRGVQHYCAVFALLMIATDRAMSIPGSGVVQLQL